MDVQHKSMQDVKRVIRRFKKDEDAKILKEVEKCNGSIDKALNKLERIFKSRHTRRSIRERYVAFLSKCNEEWAPEEDSILLKSYLSYGSKWSLISTFLNNRSGEQAKIRFKQLMHQKPSDKSKKKKDSENENPISDEEAWMQLDKEYMITSILQNHRIVV